MDDGAAAGTAAPASGSRSALLFGALIVTVGAFRIWWGGSAAPGRPLMSGLLVLMLPMAVQIGSARAGSPRRAAQHLLVWAGVGVAALLVVAEDGLLVANDRDGTSSLLEWLSPRWPLWSIVPTFIAHEAGPALAGSAVWIARGGARVVAARPRAGRRRRAARRCGRMAATVGVVARSRVVGWAWLPAPEPPLPGVDLRARARLPALDSFDHVTRPYAVHYEPMRVSAAAHGRAAHWRSMVTPGLRPEPQPMRVLHNGRFSLPAGTLPRARAAGPARDPLPAQGGVGAWPCRWAASGRP